MKPLLLLSAATLIPIVAGAQNTVCDSLPPLSLSVEGLPCLDSTLQFSAETEAILQTYNWTFGDGQNSGDPAPGITYDEAGLYTIRLEATDTNGCLYNDSLQLVIEDCLPPDPCADQPPLSIQADSIVCVDSLVSFSASGPDSLLRYDWQLDAGQRSEEAMPSASYDTPGLYAAVLVAVDEEGCTYSANFPFEVEFCEPDGGCYYVFPNTFTPNGDQTNDTFGLLANCPVSDYQVRIFNRWGKEVYQTDDPERGWDGNVQGQAAPTEVYYFVARFEQADGQTRQLQGDVSLVR